MVMKTCGMCKESKDTSLFYKNKMSRDKFHYWCRECVRIKNKLKYDPVYYRDYYLKNSERINQYHEEHYEKNKKRINERCLAFYQANKAHINEKTRLWQINHPNECSAHRLTTEAIKKGILVRPMVCECGCGKKAKTEFHHHDYEKPLEGIFLTRSCHRKFHRGNSPELNKRIEEFIFKKYKSDIKIVSD